MRLKCCSHGAIATAIFISTICPVRYQCKCSHGAIATTTLNSIQPIKCNKQTQVQSRRVNSLLDVFLNMKISVKNVLNILQGECTLTFMYCLSLQMKSYFATYEEFFQENLPKLHSHFEKQGPNPRFIHNRLVRFLFSISVVFFGLNLTAPDFP